MKIFWKIRTFLKAFFGVFWGVLFFCLFGFFCCCCWVFLFCFVLFYTREINNNKVRKETWGCKEEPRQMWAGVGQCSVTSCEISACCGVAFVKHSPLWSSQAGTFMSDRSIAMSCSRVCGGEKNHSAGEGGAATVPRVSGSSSLLELDWVSFLDYRLIFDFFISSSLL